MEEAILGIVSLVFGVFVYIFRVSIRPWKYCLSKQYRNKTNNELSGESKYKTLMHVFGGFAAIILSIILVVLLIKFAFMQPEPSSLDKFEKKAKNLIIESIIKAKEGK